MSHQKAAYYLHHQQLSSSSHTKYMHHKATSSSRSNKVHATQPKQDKVSSGQTHLHVHVPTKPPNCISIYRTQ